MVWNIGLIKMVKENNDKLSIDHLDNSRAFFWANIIFICCLFLYILNFKLII